MKLARIFILSILLTSAFVFNWNCGDENAVVTNKSEKLQTDDVGCPHLVQITQSCCVNLSTVWVQVHDPNNFNNVVAMGYPDATGEFGWKSNITTYTVYAWQTCGDIHCAAHEINVFIDCNQTYDVPLDD